MKKYQCSICNKKHAVFYSTESPMPDELENMESDESIERLNDNAFLVNNKHLIISGDINIETEIEDLNMQHRIWVKINAKDFFLNYEALKAQNEINMDCELLSELSFYPKSKGLKAHFKMQSSIYGRIKVNSESKLKEDQENPISELRVIELMEKLYHFGDMKRKTFERPFAERFKDIIEIAKNEYQANGKMFVINLSSANEVLYQIVASNMLNKPIENGLGLHISNDETKDDYETVKSSMSKLYEKMKLEFIQLDEIDTYQKYYSWNDTELENDVLRIISKTYDANKDEIKIDIFEP